MIDLSTRVHALSSDHRVNVHGNDFAHDDGMTVLCYDYGYDDDHHHCAHANEHDPDCD
jgi:hypothetical protein